MLIRQASCCWVSPPLFPQTADEPSCLFLVHMPFSSRHHGSTLCQNLSTLQKSIFPQDTGFLLRAQADGFMGSVLSCLLFPFTSYRSSLIFTFVPRPGLIRSRWYATNCPESAGTDRAPDPWPFIFSSVVSGESFSKTRYRSSGAIPIPYLR